MPMPGIEFFADAVSGWKVQPWRRVCDASPASSRGLALRVRNVAHRPELVYAVHLSTLLFPKSKDVYWMISLPETPDNRPIIFVRKHAPSWLPVLWGFALDMRRAYAPALCAAYARFERVMMTQMLLEGQAGTWKFSTETPMTLRSDTNRYLPVVLPPPEMFAIDPEHPTRSIDQIFADIPRTRVYHNRPASPYEQWKFEVPESAHARMRMLQALEHTR